jgi:hypothetical protein
VTVDHSTVNGNTARDGGGIMDLHYDQRDGAAPGDSYVNVIDSLKTGNTARRRGGGICAGNYDPFYGIGAVTIERSTISGNAAGPAGGGIYCSGAVNVASSKVDGNTINGTQFAYSQYAGGASIFASGAMDASQTELVPTRFQQHLSLVLPEGGCDRGHPSRLINARSLGTTPDTAVEVEFLSLDR